MLILKFMAAILTLWPLGREKAVDKPCSFTGLFHDDCLYENDDVKEALRRLPQNLKDDRHYRMHRAIHLSMTKTVLPKDEWFSYEDVRLFHL